MEEPVERAAAADDETIGYRAVAGLIGALTAIATFLALRPAPPVIARPARSAEPIVSPATVLVHVAGAVRKPGVYALVPGARVADAVAAAGGARPRADLGALNLAEVVRDGMQIVVGSGSSRAAPAPAAAGSPAPVVVDLNAADQIALESVPGIGPVKGAAIIAHRTEIGSFSAVEDLLDVAGIGPATLEAIRPYVTV